MPVISIGNMFQIIEMFAHIYQCHTYQFHLKFTTILSGNIHVIGICARIIGAILKIKTCHGTLHRYGFIFS